MNRKSCFAAASLAVVTISSCAIGLAAPAHADDAAPIEPTSTTTAATPVEEPATSPATEVTSGLPSDAPQPPAADQDETPTPDPIPVADEQGETSKPEPAHATAAADDASASEPAPAAVASAAQTSRAKPQPRAASDYATTVDVAQVGVSLTGPKASLTVTMPMGNTPAGTLKNLTAVLVNTSAYELRLVENVSSYDVRITGSGSANVTVESYDVPSPVTLQPGASITVTVAAGVKTGGTAAANPSAAVGYNVARVYNQNWNDDDFYNDGYPGSIQQPHMDSSVYTVNASDADLQGVLDSEHWSIGGASPGEVYGQHAVLANDLDVPIVVRYVGANDAGTIAPYIGETIKGWPGEVTLRPGESTSPFDLLVGMPSFIGNEAKGTSGTFWWQWSITAIDAPVAVDDETSTAYGAPVDIDVLANDSGAGLTVTGVEGDGDTATVGSWQSAVDGDGRPVVRFTPADGFTGTATATYTVTDAYGQIATATITVTVGAPPVEPVVVDDRREVGAGGSVTLDPLANDSGFVADTLTLDVDAAELPDAWHLNADGTVTFTAPAGFVGQTRIGYSWRSVDGLMHEGVITVTVAAAPAKPSEPAIKPDQQLPVVGDETIASTSAPDPTGQEPYHGRGLPNTGSSLSESDAWTLGLVGLGSVGIGTWLVAARRRWS
ncbi:Ig-like domain-containing protein [Propionicicella superfundia]|uniref:Ig-like domain-containing protein n=1 Tax=Propionicicella superfundia TaxID=348582 RepID=UPI00042829D9|nr:Ig-like domain-containing protein [Propionicicella superfundia]